MVFEGLPEGKINFDRLPAAFFTELLPQIDHLGELKVTLYVLWRLDRMEGEFRYLLDEDFIRDDRFLTGLHPVAERARQILAESLFRCLERGTLLKAEVQLRGQPTMLYFFNSPKGRACVEAIENGMWRPVENESRIPIELVPERPNIYQLYEENIGLITPLLAEALVDAEKDYPANWIEEAFRIAVEKNIRNWRYIQAILHRWQERGYDAREDRRDTEKARKQYTSWED
jgi:DnaD/phage-associated family protein